MEEGSPKLKGSSQRRKDRELLRKAINYQKKMHKLDNMKDELEHGESDNPYMEVINLATSLGGMSSISTKELSCDRLVSSGRRSLKYCDDVTDDDLIDEVIVDDTLEIEEVKEVSIDMICKPCHGHSDISSRNDQETIPDSMKDFLTKIVADKISTWRETSSSGKDEDIPQADYKEMIDRVTHNAGVFLLNKATVELSKHLK